MQMVQSANYEMLGSEQRPETEWEDDEPYEDTWGLPDFERGDDD